MTIITVAESPRIERALWGLLLAATAGLLGFGCATAAPRPEEMSAAEHRGEARAERTVAGAHRAARKREAKETSTHERSGVPVPDAAPAPGGSGFHLLEAA